MIASFVSGRALCRHLVTLGVPAQKIVRKQETGDYVADFFTHELAEPVAPAKEWAKRIREVLPSARIIDTHDTVAAWRPGQPVIYATVIFRLLEVEEDETDIASMDVSIAQEPTPEELGWLLENIVISDIPLIYISQKEMETEQAMVDALLAKGGLMEANPKKIMMAQNSKFGTYYEFTDNWNKIQWLKDEIRMHFE